MASPPTASRKTRSRSASSRASTTRSASSSAAPTVYATRNICGSRCSHACFQRSEVAKNTHTTSRRPRKLGNLKSQRNQPESRKSSRKRPPGGQPPKPIRFSHRNSRFRKGPNVPEALKGEAPRDVNASRSGFQSNLSIGILLSVPFPCSEACRRKEIPCAPLLNRRHRAIATNAVVNYCLLYTSDAADEE